MPMTFYYYSYYLNKSGQTLKEALNGKNTRMKEAK